MLKGGVIGFGNIGQQLTRHVAAAWQGRATIVAACNRGPANLAVARDGFGLAVTHDPDELLDRDLDFVLVPGVSPVQREVVRPEMPACAEWRRACLTPWARLGNRNDARASDVRRRVSEACEAIFARASVSCTAWPSTLDLRRMPVATATR